MITRCKAGELAASRWTSSSSLKNRVLRCGFFKSFTVFLGCSPSFPHSCAL